MMLDDRDEFIDTLCPVCGKNFIPAPFHLYKVNWRRVCSWTCQLRGEREGFKHIKYKVQPVVAFDVRGNCVGEFPNASEAAKTLNLNPNYIRLCCRGIRGETEGYSFKYKKEEEAK